jgi:large subunit ribosomal protein L3
MPTLSRPRAGSLQFYPRVRSRKQVPKTNWKKVPAKDKDKVLGFLTYKVGMSTAIVKDNTDKSMTLGKTINIPVTILEAPSMKIFSVRFYNKGKVTQDTIVSKDKELKKKLKLPKVAMDAKTLVAPKEFDDVRIIAYSLVKTTGVKKKPDLTELAVSADDKLEFIKSLIGKEITLDHFNPEMIDARATTKGKGFSGPVKRFGITLKSHKSEKGVRRPGSLAPWHPARVTFRTPMAGQLGNASRVHYNLSVVKFGKIADLDINPKKGFINYGNIKTNYIIVKGSVQGSRKKQVLVTPSFRPTKITAKQKLEFKELSI